MPGDFLKEIEKIPYPDEHLEDLKRAIPLAIAAMERDGLPIESGLINLRKVDEELDVALFFVRWIQKFNEIIENLNIVLADMRALPTNYVLLKGPPETRYYLLIRTYFYEFYRFREIHHQVVKAVADRGYIKRNEIAGVRDAFHDACKDAIELRNNLVHGSPVWTGNMHFDLNLLVHARDRGLALQHRETGEILKIGAVLQDICQSRANILSDEGNRMSKILQALIRVYVDLAKKAS